MSRCWGLFTVNWHSTYFKIY